MTGPSQPEKLCPSCGATVPGDANVCSRCGYNFNTGPYAQPPNANQPPVYGTPAPPPSAAPGGVPGQNWQQPAPYFRPNYDEPSKSADGFAIAGLVTGILSLISFCVWCVAIPLGAVALVTGGLGLKGRNRNVALAGMICGGAGILIAIAILIVLQVWGRSLTNSSFMR